MDKRNPVIHFWVPYPIGVAPSQRFRVELFLPRLDKEGYSFKLLTFLDKKAWDILYKPGHRFLKAWGTVKGFFRRIDHLFQSTKADYIFIHREATPLGPPVFEWLLAKIFRKKIIHEYDDAIWIPGGEDISFMKKWLKATWKIKYIIKWSYKVVAGNDFLCEYARKYNAAVFLIPTVVDTEHGHYKQKDQNEGSKIVVGWTGTHTTLHNLEVIEGVIPELKKEIDFDFFIISNKPPDWNFDFIYKQWELETEQEDLLKMHIGIMPLKEGPWFEGKCGFKLIQYLSCGIPTIASPVGVNPKIIHHKENGFIAANKKEWIEYLKILISDPQLRSKMAEKGRKHVVDEYSLTSASINFLTLFINE
ncbi:MAG TPA: glycosyltransferase [Chitinophagaceae bacterium]|nr:glycosyltransferase [Chitinophagaceae bacterium]